MTSNDLPVLYAIQYSEFDINRGAYIYYEVNLAFNFICSRRLNSMIRYLLISFRQLKQCSVKINVFNGYVILSVPNRIYKIN
jgi:hypothetical protein